MAIRCDLENMRQPQTAGKGLWGVAQIECWFVAKTKPETKTKVMNQRPDFLVPCPSNVRSMDYHYECEGEILPHHCLGPSIEIRKIS